MSGTDVPPLRDLIKDTLLIFTKQSTKERKDEEEKKPSSRHESNPRPHCYEACALPLCHNRGLIFRWVQNSTSCSPAKTFFSVPLDFRRRVVKNFFEAFPQKTKLFISKIGLSPFFHEKVNLKRNSYLLIKHVSPTHALDSCVVFDNYERGSQEKKLG